MTIHINANKDDFSDIVLMPGDPLRAKYIAEKYLTDSVLVNNTRAMLGFTGYYKKCKISVLSHGIGIPSCSIYVYELVKSYNVKKIIRIGTCGTIHKNIKLRDIIIGMGACTDSQVNRIRFNNYDFSAIADFQMMMNMVLVAKKLQIPILIGNLFSTDLFYCQNDDFRLTLIKKFNILGIEMETAGIYGLSAELGVKSLSVCTVSDHILHQEHISSQDREQTFDDMILLALESVLL
ncbi:Purine nucleoside phosphorylase DeoD-type [Buchnera aphidicola (Eriosoma grossulariae)]|uniref:purine-nucleoside phosphorylase n=1 Tax=Buchnera aphidicola TaxID=9 RepID=UPI003464800F